ncbi:MAG: CTP-dependent riboflavin kinase [Thaumarchaeota archaeon]|nr:CTP-dependent riboflavin kinase [Nitrososphaerota archaeon]
MPKLITGVLFSGLGDGAKFVRLDWVESQIEEKLGFRPYHGTINLRLDMESIDLVRKLKDDDGVKIVPPDPKFCIAKTFKAKIMGKVEGAIILPEATVYGEDTLELLAPINMREELDLKDGQQVEVEIEA